MFDYTTNMSDVAKEIGPLLTSLTQQGKLAFAYSVAVRMQPQYQAFYDREGWGDPAVIKASLGAIHDTLERVGELDLGLRFDTLQHNLNVG